MDALSSAFETLSVTPQLAERKVTMDVFHVYKDELMKKEANDLPVEIVVRDSAHDAVLRSVLLNHPRAADKVGVGIKYIFVRRLLTTEGDDVCCCYVKRVDDTEEDFSVFKAYRETSWKNKGTRFDAVSGGVVRAGGVEGGSIGLSKSGV